MRGKKSDGPSAELRAIPLFAGCSDDELGEIDHLMARVSLPAGHVLTREGAGSLEFVVIVEGSVAVERDGATIAALGAGDFVGEMGLLGGTTRSATVRAETALVAYVANAGEFAGLLEASPGLREKLENAAAARTSER